MDDLDLDILAALDGLVAPTPVAADWQDVLRRAQDAFVPWLNSAAAAERVPMSKVSSRRQAALDSQGWGTRPLRRPAGAAGSTDGFGSEPLGWGTRPL